MLKALMYVCTDCGYKTDAPGYCTEHGRALVEITENSLIGTRVGNYQITRQIGQGGMGSVYEAAHPNIGSRVAVKVLSKQCADNPSLVERFFSEARAVNVIRHERIVSVLDLDQLEDGRPYIVMELLEGQSLSNLMSVHGAFPLGTAVNLLLELLDALFAVHQHGIVHRDLKPDNILVTKTGHLKVVDFGIAKLRPELGGVEGGTRTGALMGTPLYMAPEQAAGRAVDARADLYSAGVVLFEMVTGQRPFAANSLYELLKAHVERMPPQPTSLRAGIPPSLENVLLRALQKDPAHRYQSAREFSTALEATMRDLLPTSFVAPTALLSSIGAGAQPPKDPTSHQPSTPRGATGTPQILVRSSATVPGPRKNKRFGYFAFATCGLVLIAAFGSCVACFGISASQDSETIEIALGSGEVAVIKPAKFDPTAFAPRAVSAAQKQDPKARFVGLRATGYFSSSSMNMRRDPASRVVYQFVAKGRCLEVDVSPTGLSTRSIQKCPPRPLRLPRCSMKQVGEGARERGAPYTWRDATLTYHRSPAGQPEWRLRVSGKSFTGPDDC